MRIGIDIDGVLTDVGRFVIDYMTKYCVDNNIEYNITGSNYEYYKAFNISEKQEDDFWEGYLEYYAVNAIARPFAAEVIKKLRTDGHEIYIVTARWLTNRDDAAGERMRETVRAWLAKNNISYDKLIFTKATGERKHQEILANRISLIIEDNPRNIQELAEIIPVICYHSEYNQDCSGNNIIRCYSWYDIYHKLSEISGGTDRN